MGYLYNFGSPVLAVLTVYYVISLFITRKRRQSQIKQYGCRAPPKYPHKEPFLGYDLFKDNMENAKNSNLLARWLYRFQQHGPTFSANFLGVPAICTVDPINLYAILSTNFKDYGVQPLRRAATLPFLGEGVFTMDGEFWEYSRALVRPTFNKTNVANLPAFEANLVKFMDLLLRDGSTVDLKPLLCKLVCFLLWNLDPSLTLLQFIDTSTLFLFGESMGILDEKTPIASQKFLDAFHYAQRGTGRRL